MPMTEQITAACDTCAVTIVVTHDRNDRTLIRVVHAPNCPDAWPTADVARANG